VGTSWEAGAILAGRVIKLLVTKRFSICEILKGLLNLSCLFHMIIYIPWLAGRNHTDPMLF
jgi:hypothetical protein